MRRQPPHQSTLAKTIRELLLLGIGIALIYMLLAPEAKKPFHPVSMADLKGVWTTSHPHYRDRFLQFADETLTFGWGPAGMGSYTIDTIDSEPDADGTLVRIRYRDLALSDYQLNFFYVDQSGGIIQMKNQKEVYWLHTSDQPTHDPRFK